MGNVCHQFESVLKEYLKFIRLMPGFQKEMMSCCHCWSVS